MSSRVVEVERDALICIAAGGKPGILRMSGDGLTAPILRRQTVFCNSGEGHTDERDDYATRADLAALHER